MGVKNFDRGHVANKVITRITSLPFVFGRARLTRSIDLLGEACRWRIAWRSSWSNSRRTKRRSRRTDPHGQGPGCRLPGETDSGVSLYRFELGGPGPRAVRLWSASRAKLREAGQSPYLCGFRRIARERPVH